MAEAATPLVGIEHPAQGCAVVTLQRPQVLNALSLALRLELARTFARLAADGTTRVVILTGAGRAFCAGVDLRELAGAADLAQVAAGGQADDPVHALLAFPGPVIAAVNGPAITGGLELAIACDIVIASERATFADTHARVGVLPSWGLSQRLPRLVGRGRALQMSLTGNFVDARQAQAWGLVNDVVAHDALLPTAVRLATDMLSTAPGMLERYKRLVDDGLATTLQEGLGLEAQRSREWAASIDRRALAAQTQAVQERGRAAQRDCG
jgi:enoyl-CoA hydratase